MKVSYAAIVVIPFWNFATLLYDDIGDQKLPKGL